MGLMYLDRPPPGTEEGLTAPAPADEELTDEEPAAGLTDDELTALALAADPDEPVAPDALPWDLHGSGQLCLLPNWYMPPVMAVRARGWRVPVVVLLIGAFLLVDALGLCFTYGQLVAA